MQEERKTEIVNGRARNEKKRCFPQCKLLALITGINLFSQNFSFKKETERESVCD